jgi:hypothetical protein
MASPPDGFKSQIADMEKAANAAFDYFICYAGLSTAQPHKCSKPRRTCVTNEIIKGRIRGLFHICNFAQILQQGFKRQLGIILRHAFDHFIDLRLWHAAGSSKTVDRNAQDPVAQAAFNLPQPAENKPSWGVSEDSLRRFCSRASNASWALFCVTPLTISSICACGMLHLRNK